MRERVELDDEELDKVIGGIDLDVLNIDNIKEFWRCLLLEDNEKCVEMVNDFLARGTDPGTIDLMIEKFASTNVFKNSLRALLKRF